MRNNANIALSLVSLFAIGAAAAADDPIAKRRELMLQTSHLEDVANRVIQGRYPVAKAVSAMRNLADNLTVFPTLFPEGSNTGFTEAAPAIWENMEDFQRLAAKLVTDARSAETAAAALGREAFAQAFLAVETDCHDCHAKYNRIRK